MKSDELLQLVSLDLTARSNEVKWDLAPYVPVATRPPDPGYRGATGGAAAYGVGTAPPMADSRATDDGSPISSAA